MALLITTFRVKQLLNQISCSMFLFETDIIQQRLCGVVTFSSDFFFYVRDYVRRYHIYLYTISFFFGSAFNIHCIYLEASVSVPALYSCYCYSPFLRQRVLDLGLVCLPGYLTSILLTYNRGRSMSNVKSK